MTVTAAPLVTSTEPPSAMRMESGAPLAAVAVVIGVVRLAEITVSAWAVAARQSGASATAVRNILRIEQIPGQLTRRTSPAVGLYRLRDQPPSFPILRRMQGELCVCGPHGMHSGPTYRRRLYCHI